MKNNNLIKTVGLIITLATLPVFTAMANTVSFVNTDKIFTSHGFLSTIGFQKFQSIAVKGGQPYDQANDPAFKTSAGGPEVTSPQHGYFAVPIIVIGLLGIVLYFSRFD